ncbi:MAG TPA: hypothetical protein VGN26_19210 [Armatimonadota bacterium]|jgi:uncharacterized coiled-coil protein SlyX
MGFHDLKDLMDGPFVVVAFILAGCLGSAILRLTEAVSRRVQEGPRGKRRTAELESRIAALEQRLKASDDRLETVRDIVFSTDYEARRRLMEKMPSQEETSASPRPRTLEQR